MKPESLKRIAISGFELVESSSAEVKRWIFWMVLCHKGQVVVVAFFSEMEIATKGVQGIDQILLDA